MGSMVEEVLHALPDNLSYEHWPEFVLDGAEFVYADDNELVNLAKQDIHRPVFIRGQLLREDDNATHFIASDGNTFISDLWSGFISHACGPATHWASFGSRYFELRPSARYKEIWGPIERSLGVFWVNTTWEEIQIDIGDAIGDNVTDKMVYICGLYLRSISGGTQTVHELLNDVEDCGDLLLAECEKNQKLRNTPLYEWLMDIIPVIEKALKEANEFETNEVKAEIENASQLSTTDLGLNYRKGYKDAYISSRYPDGVESFTSISHVINVVGMHAIESGEYTLKRLSSGSLKTMIYRDFNINRPQCNVLLSVNASMITKNLPHELSTSTLAEDLKKLTAPSTNTKDIGTSSKKKGESKTTTSLGSSDRKREIRNAILSESGIGETQWKRRATQASKSEPSAAVGRSSEVVDADGDEKMADGGPVEMEQYKKQRILYEDNRGRAYYELRILDDEFEASGSVTPFANEPFEHGPNVALPQFYSVFTQARMRPVNAALADITSFGDGTLTTDSGSNANSPASTSGGIRPIRRLFEASLNHR